MLLKVLRAKIHLATVTEAELEYVGSIAIDRDLMDAVGLADGECVLVADMANGNRFETYVIEGERGSGVICVNGAAARLVNVGDHVIVMAFGYMGPDEAGGHKPNIVLVDRDNKVAKRV
jgi:aspartate 1-decarboxylase